MRSLAAVLALLLLCAPAVAPAVTLSGVMLYGTDDYGNPAGPFNEQEGKFTAGQLWHTQLGGDWYGLGILPDLPPNNMGEPVLNLPDFSINVPLMEGENDFSMVGEAGGMTRTDPYTRFALNLYFDGVLDRPGISVLFDRSAPLGGAAPLPNQSPVIYNLAVVQVEASAETTYTFGPETVTVIAASFVSPLVHKLDYDKVQAHRPEPTDTGGEGGADRELGGLDFLGVLKIDVEGPSSGGPMGAGAPAPAAFGVQPESAAVGPDLLGNPERGGPIAQPAQAGTPGSGGLVQESSRSGQQVATGNTPAPSESEATPGGQTPTPDGTVTAGTQTPRSTGAGTAGTTPTAAAITKTPDTPATPQLTPAGTLTPAVLAPRPVVTPSAHTPKLKPRKK